MKLFVPIFELKKGICIMSLKIEIGDEVKMAVDNDQIDLMEGHVGDVVDIDWEEAFPYLVNFPGVGERWVSDEEIILIVPSLDPEPVVTENPVTTALAEQVGSTFQNSVQIFCPYCGHNFQVEVKS
jgi:hypothetical protein